MNVINKQNNAGQTPIHCACIITPSDSKSVAHTHLAILNTLLKYPGIDFTIKDNAGVTVREAIDNFVSYVQSVK